MIVYHYILKGIVWGYLIFSASTKTNCWILELCIWLVRKLIGLPLLKRTPHQSKAEACYRQITCFYKKTYEPRTAKTMILRTWSRIYITYETHKKGISFRVLIYGSFLSADSSFCHESGKNALFPDFPNIYQFETTINQKSLRDPHSNRLNESHWKFWFDIMYSFR